MPCSLLGEGYSLWPSGPDPGRDPCVSNGRNRMGHPKTVTINREIKSAAPGTVAEYYFRFAAAAVANGRTLNNGDPATCPMTSLFGMKMRSNSHFRLHALLLF